MRTKSFQNITIEEINVRFPFEPYDEQIQYMSTVLKALKGEASEKFPHSHAVLESPTGSGKTLALLCSVCAWVLSRRNATVSPNRDRDNCLAASGENCEKTNIAAENTTESALSASSRKFRILYTTRTHAQVAQAVKEFRRSGYDTVLTSCILGSREQMCIEPRALQHKASPTMLKAACRHLCSSQKCRYRHGVAEKAAQDLKKQRDAVAIEGVISDIEELQLAGKKEIFCPYYYTREVLLPTAEIIFCPYNYVLDPSIAAQIDAGIAQSKHSSGNEQTRALSFLDNAILIIDEAHNLPSTCLGVSSIDLSTKDVERAVYESSKALGWTQQQIKEKETDNSSETSDISIAPSETTGKEKRSLQVDAKELQVLCKLLCNIEKHMQVFPLAHHTPTQTQSHTASGDHIYTFLSALNIHAKTSHLLIDMLQKTIDAIVERSDATVSSENLGSTMSFTGLQTILSFLRFVFPVKEVDKKLTSGASKSKADAVKCALRHEELKTAYSFVVQKLTTHVDTNARKYVNGPSETTKNTRHTISLWCLDASLTMQRLHQIVRNIIVTSGTLSPISSFIYELKIPFQHVFPSSMTTRPHARLAANSPRVVSKAEPSAKVCVSICPNGCCDTELNSSYTKRDTAEYKLSVGNSILNLLRIIPDGVLIFFPSYSFMRNMLSFWGYSKGGHTSGIWENMKKYKSLFIEEADRSQNDHAKISVAEIIEKYQSAIRGSADAVNHPNTAQGAALFAVCRGRLSEGIDFADELARGVIIVGIPYMNITDLNVYLRKKYFDGIVENAKQLKCLTASENHVVAQAGPVKSKDSFDATTYLTGDVWYQQESMRAVNQAMGRAIRHKNDYGAIILLDKRFQSRLGDFSGWIRPHTEVSDSFSGCAARIAAFFRSKSRRSFISQRNVSNAGANSLPKTASKRSFCSIANIQSAVQFEQNEELKSKEKESTKADTTSFQSQAGVQKYTVGPTRQSQITPSGSVNRSSSFPRSFFGTKKEE